MTIRSPFKPHYGTNQQVSVTASSSNSAINADDKSVRIVNSGLNLTYIKVGTGAQTATSADLMLDSGNSIVIEKAMGENNIAYISASGTTLQIMTGEGGY
jgi:hypothetical protein